MRNVRTTKLFQVRDTLARSVMGPIITAYHEAAAIRIFTDALKDTRTQIANHPEDYELVTLGSQNEETGEITPYLDGPQIVLTGKQWTIVQQGESSSSEREQMRSDAKD